MQITLGTPKGGAGKTTALLSLANAAMLRSPASRIALVDTDASVGSLRAFMSRRADMEDDGRVRLWCASEKEGLDHLGDTLRRAHDWADYILVDVHGAGSRFNTLLVEISDLTLFPTRIGLTDFEPAGMMYARYEAHAEARGIPFKGRLLFTFAPNAHFLSANERKILAGLRVVGVPFLETIIQTRAAYKDAQDMGRFLREMPPSQGLSAATAESIGMFDEIMAILGKPNPLAEAEERNAANG